MKINDIYEIKINDVDNNGNGVARIDNFVVFIPCALLNEIVKVRITNINKHFAYGKIIEILDASNDRITPTCKYYNICGGCTFLHTSYDNEMSIKIKYLEKLFNMKVDHLVNNNIINYRNKVTLHVLNGKLGYFNDQTHDLCEIDSCLLLNDKINSKISEIKNYNLNGISEIMIKCINNEIMINILGNKIHNELYNINCDSLYINDKYLKGKEYLIDEINDYKFSIYPESFYQVNKEGMTNIYNKALEYADSGNKLLDLYCGTGTIGIWMNNNFKKIIGIEINEKSIKNANINKVLNNLNNIEFIQGDSKKAKYYIKDADVIVVDPPRNGLSNDVVNIINNSNCNKIIYISCNPKTLKRDSDLMNNFILKSISCSSMFPRTKHIECVSLFIRR